MHPSSAHLRAQFRWLSKDLPYLQKLKTSYIVKAIITSTLIVLAIAFGITMYWSNDVGGERLIHCFPSSMNALLDLSY